MAVKMICNTDKLILEHHQRGREGKSSMDEHEQRKHLQEVNLIIFHLLISHDVSSPFAVASC